MNISSGLWRRFRPNHEYIISMLLKWSNCLFVSSGISRSSYVSQVSLGNRALLQPSQYDWDNVKETFNPSTNKQTLLQTMLNDIDRVAFFISVILLFWSNLDCCFQFAFIILLPKGHMSLILCRTLVLLPYQLATRMSLRETFINVNYTLVEQGSSAVKEFMCLRSAIPYE